jgi:hypothetical protein
VPTLAETPKAGLEFPKFTAIPKLAKTSGDGNPTSANHHLLLANKANTGDGLQHTTSEQASGSAQGADRTYASLYQGFRAADPVFQRVIFQQGYSCWDVVLTTLGIRLVKKLFLEAVGAHELFSFPTSVIFFVAGEWQAMEHWLVQLMKRYRVIIALSHKCLPPPLDRSQQLPSPMKGPPLSWHRVKHAACNGVSSGEWFCGLNFPVLRPLKLEVLQRCIWHIVKPANPGRKTQFPDGENAEAVWNSVKWLKDGLHPGGHFPLDKLGAFVLAPSVFAPWVHRKLTIEELFDVIDLPVDQRDMAMFKPRSDVALATF